MDSITAGAYPYLVLTAEVQHMDKLNCYPNADHSDYHASENFHSRTSSRIKVHHEGCPPKGVRYAPVEETTKNE